jgi:hypothetical protein
MRSRRRLEVVLISRRVAMARPTCGEAVMLDLLYLLLTAVLLAISIAMIRFFDRL